MKGLIYISLNLVCVRYRDEWPGRQEDGCRHRRHYVGYEESAGVCPEPV